MVISFMGVDGSGKSTLIEELKKKLINKFKDIKYIHLRPYFFLIDKNTVNSNPHKFVKPIPKIVNFIRLIIWLINYKIYFLFKIKKNHLIIFDRYVDDLLIDRIRYRFNLSKKTTKLMLKLFPQPNLWIILEAPIDVIERRKKELPPYIIKKQMNDYLIFARKKKKFYSDKHKSIN